ncbi:14 kDa proline-rich protein DC2.15-like [Dioscorea cayenensis subsp. rotundata]|uniref:14 kDa proline-rich protein DC2.15-like n=1 Tax=Dioscorea cayennensis subsp. rotundata TaxID=55577 RepID=A0AB40CTA8_DIOCR|nr:14 kDa proline-rich protein DC2.15-like [Dioscorea cayenensis subsp. rotundata]
MVWRSPELGMGGMANLNARAWLRHGDERQMRSVATGGVSDSPVIPPFTVASPSPPRSSYNGGCERHPFVVSSSSSTFSSSPLGLAIPVVTPAASPPSGGQCPPLGACVTLVDYIREYTKLERPPIEPCCSLIKGLLNHEVAECLCAELKVNVEESIIIDFDDDLQLVFDNCGMQAPPGFHCSIGPV